MAEIIDVVMRRLSRTSGGDPDTGLLLPAGDGSFPHERG